MFALADCNNFYASCERVFKPWLRTTPIVVLSNNDGCVIARSNETKALGIKMGVPAYQIKDAIDQYGIEVFSSNYTLYGDMSNRVMSMLGSYVEEMEVYSIDEAFLHMDGFGQLDLKSYGEQIVKSVTQGTGIPISMGIAPTKTLAKVANKFAKKYPNYKGVCLIDSDEKRIKALQLTEIGDVWGIGRQHAKMLAQHGVKNAYDFAQLPKAWVRQKMTVVGERMWKELNGESCIEMELAPAPKKQICTSRSFGHMVTDFSELEEAVSTYVCMCAEKLRAQKSCAASLMVFIHTNNFRSDLPQYFKNYVIKLPVPTSSSLELVKYALMALRLIYVKGYQFKKAGVIITEIVDEGAVQMDLFDNVDREKHAKIMKVMDALNSGFDHRKLSLAVQGSGRKWKLRREKLSPCYTTNLQEVIEVRTDR